MVSMDPRLGGAQSALRGPCQTAQRGEVCAVAIAVAIDPVRLFVLTDSQYFERRLRALLGCAGVSGKHGDLWSALRRGIQMVMG